jgi:hypothetical protein
MDIQKQIVTDLFEVIRSQHRVISALVANDQALVQTLANDSALSYFVDSFQNKQTYALAHPTGPLAEVLSVMQGKLDAIGKTLKRDTGGWDN